MMPRQNLLSQPSGKTSKLIWPPAGEEEEEEKQKRLTRLQSELRRNMAAACALLTNGKWQSFPFKLFLQRVHKLLSDLLLLHGEKMKKKITEHLLCLMCDVTSPGGTAQSKASLKLFSSFGCMKELHSGRKTFVCSHTMLIIVVRFWFFSFFNQTDSKKNTSLATWHLHNRSDWPPSWSARSQSRHWLQWLHSDKATRYYQWWKNKQPGVPLFLWLPLIP